MNPVKEIRESLKENHGEEHSKLFLEAQNAILNKFC
jgi:hypothetical protein